MMSPVLFNNSSFFLLLSIHLFYFGFLQLSLSCRINAAHFTVSVDVLLTFLQPLAECSALVALLIQAADQDHPGEVSICMCVSGNMLDTRLIITQTAVRL